MHLVNNYGKGTCNQVHNNLTPGSNRIVDMLEHERDIQPIYRTALRWERQLLDRL